VNFLVSHPVRMWPGPGEEDVEDRAAADQSLDIIHAENGGGVKCASRLETTGQGTYLGGRFEQIAPHLKQRQRPGAAGGFAWTPAICFAAGFT